VTFHESHTEYYYEVFYRSLGSTEGPCWPPATHFFAFAETGGMRDATPLKSYCNGQRYDIVMGFVGRG